VQIDVQLEVQDVPHLKTTRNCNVCANYSRLFLYNVHARSTSYSVTMPGQIWPKNSSL